MNFIESYINWSIRPEIFSAIPFLRWYGVMWALGLLGAIQIMQWIYKKDNHPLEKLDKLTLYMIIGIILGARLGHVFFYDFAYYLERPIEILPIRLEPSFQFTGFAGLASHGGVIGALLALYIYNRKYPQGYLWLLDRLTISAAFLGGFIRLGNLMNSEIIGIPTSVPWAFIFSDVDGIPRHPAQLYEAIFYFIIFGILMYMRRIERIREATGVIFGAGLGLIFFQRFFVEFLKENQVAFEEGMALNMGQILSIPMVLIAGITIYLSFKKSQKTQ